jgi:hypothetical protein
MRGRHGRGPTLAAGAWTSFRAIVFASQGCSVAFLTQVYCVPVRLGGRLVEREAQRWRRRVFQCSLLDEDGKRTGCGFTDVRRREVADACSGKRVDALGTGRLGLEINWEALGRRRTAGRQS